MNTPPPPREHALQLIAAYERSNDPHERELVRIARLWLTMITSHDPLQHLVDQTIDDLNRHSDGSCGWNDLRTAFLHWAKANEWTE